MLPVILLVLTCGCNTYHYFTPPVNAPVFEGGGEFQLSGNASITGFSGKTAYSITDNVAATGMIHFGYVNSSLGFMIDNERYRSTEGELAVGLYNPKTGSGGNAYGALFIGYGGGINSDQWMTNDSVNPIQYTRFEGTFHRPFVQLTFGKNGDGEHLKFLGQSLKGSVSTSNSFSMRMNYFSYSGNEFIPDSANIFTGTPLSISNFFFEPYYTGTIGGKIVRAEFGIGCPLNFSVFENEKSGGLRVFPLHAHIGLCVILGRKK